MNDPDLGSIIMSLNALLLLTFFFSAASYFYIKELRKLMSECDLYETKGE